MNATHGMPSMLLRVIRKLRYLWRRIARHRNHVYARTDKTSGWPASNDLRFVCCPKPEAVTAEFREMMVEAHGAEILESDRWEMDHGAKLWLVFVDDQYAGSSLSRTSEHYEQWHLPLQENDVIIFRNAVRPGMRGRGIGPALMRHIVNETLEPGGRALVDCKVYNRPSIRSIEKAGFRRIATVKPIPRSRQFRS